MTGQATIKALAGKEDTFVTTLSAHPLGAEVVIFLLGQLQQQLSCNGSTAWDVVTIVHCLDVVGKLRYRAQLQGVTHYLQKVWR